MKYIKILVYTCIMISGISCLEISGQTHAIDVTANEAEKFLKVNNIQIIDVRTPKEFAENHLSNAKNIDYLASNFKSALSRLDKQKPVLLYCYSGVRSASSADLFFKAGFTKVYNLKGGILHWKAAGFKMVSD